MRIKAITFYGPDDRQKAITPTLVYMHYHVKGIHVRMISLGWWHWAIGIAFINK